MNKGTSNNQRSQTEKFQPREFSDRYNSHDNRNEAEQRLLRNTGINNLSGDEEQGDQEAL